MKRTKINKEAGDVIHLLFYCNIFNTLQARKSLYGLLNVVKVARN